MLKRVLMAATLLAPTALCRAESPAADCMTAIGVVERQMRLPTQLLGAIALVESARVDPATTRAAPWPWTINVEGTGYFFPTKQDAIAAVQTLTEAHVRSIDVGCMQINLLHHPTAFHTLDDAFDPHTNVLYGAGFLTALHRQFGGWALAIAAYHSQTPGIGAEYWNRVLGQWPQAAHFTSGAPLPAVMTVRSADPNIGSELARRLAETAEDHRRNLADFANHAGPPHREPPHRRPTGPQLARLQ